MRRFSNGEMKNWALIVRMAHFYTDETEIGSTEQKLTNRQAKSIR